jgi:hypothetical protein
VLSIKAQRQYTLPDDPIRLSQVYDYNWLKKSTEKAINNVDKESYQFLYNFMYEFFYEYKDRLTTIAKDEYASNTVFNWARPYIKSKILYLDVVDKIRLYNSLKKTQGYLKTFNYELERKYLVSNETLFAFLGPEDYFDKERQYPYPQIIANEYRDFEAFMFRRIRSGVSKSLIERFLGEVISSIDVNFSQKVIQKDEYENPMYEFYWDREQFKGVYREYDINEGNGQSRIKTRRPYLKTIGEYQNGKRNGGWKYYSFYGESPTLDYEIEYSFGKPVFLKSYYDEPIKLRDGEEKDLNMIFKLNVLSKTLDVEVYSNKKLMKAYSSVHDYIEYWDIYDTKRRILRTLIDPNLDIPFDKQFTLKDKPDVPRNSETNNYKLYDELKRAGKDHALLIATDEYDHYNPYDKLSNPIRDAQAIARDLKDIYGFDCEIVKNPSKDEFIKVLDKYKNRTYGSDEQLFIFISGHGERDEGMRDGFIIPNDGKTKNSDISHSSWISYTELSSIVYKMNARHILLMVDACYSGALEDAVVKLKGTNDSLPRRMADPKAWFLSRIDKKCKMFFTSTSADKTSSDGINHSPFTSTFIRALRSIKERDAYILDDKDIFALLDKIMPQPHKEYFPDHETGSSFFFVMQ